MFSPYYALQRRRGPAQPEQHCAINVALYGAKRRWAMTERPSSRLYRDANRLQIGPSSMAFDGTSFHIAIDEVTFPVPSRIRGSVKVVPEVQNLQNFELASEGAHRWWPMVPRARIEVDLPMPGVRWSGEGYLDCNWGSGPLEDSFSHWSWSRSCRSDRSSRIFYDVESRHGNHVNLALMVTPDGRIENTEAAAPVLLPSTRWGMERRFRPDLDDPAPRVTSLEDGPFYARTLIEASNDGVASTCVHESLSLNRFASPWVQVMLPFRMPRTRR